MALVKRTHEIQSIPVDNSICAHPGCNRKGSVAWTTHAGPETKWFCSEHAFKKDDQWQRDKQVNKSKMLAEYAERIAA